MTKLLDELIGVIDDTHTLWCEEGRGGYPAVTAVVGDHIVIADADDNGPSLQVIEVARALPRFKEAKEHFANHKHNDPTYTLYDAMMDCDVLIGDTFGH